MRLKVIGCETIIRELYAAAAISKSEVVVEILPPNFSAERLQAALNCEDTADYIVLALGSCAAKGLCSKKTAVIVPKVHDCCHLLLGSDERYRRIYEQSEEAPRWLMKDGCKRCGNGYGTLSKVKSCLSFFDEEEERFDSVREYPADLTRLNRLLNGEWDEKEALTVLPMQRIAEDPVEILTSEPV